MCCVQHKKCTTVQTQEMHAYRYPSKAKGAEARFELRILATFTPTFDAFSVCNQLHQHPATHADWVAAAKPDKKQQRAVLAAATYPAIALGWQLQEPPKYWQLQ